MSRRWAALVVAAAVVGGGAISAVQARPMATTTSTASRGIDPSNYVRYVTNPFLPFRPGTVLTYRGVKDGGTQVERVAVLHRTKRIQGVVTTVVHDESRHAGRLLEQTDDWYAQDRQGNVWYFGEDTKAYGPHGQVSSEGSWQAGVRGAVPGIVMEADPQPTDGYRQEFWRGHAEDTAWVLRRGGSLHVPLGTVHHVLVTLEWSRLEPNVIDRKIYAKGLGIVREASATGPNEVSELVSVHRP
jgi:hypothetical protein